MWCLAGLAHATNLEAYRLNEAGVGEVRRGNLEAGIGLFARALEIDPQDESIRKNLARSRLLLGDRLLQAGRSQQAEREYRASLEADPSEVRGWLALGDVQLRGRDVRGAIESYRWAVNLDPGSAEALVGLGQAFYNQGDLESALAEWRRAQSLLPGEPGLQERIARAEREVRVLRGYGSRESQHFLLIYEGRREEGVGEALVQWLEQAYADIGYALGAYPDHAVQVILYPNADFTAATGVLGDVGGFYQVLDGKIRIALRGLRLDDPKLRSVLYHEYVHALVFAVTRGNNPPRWVHEGLAVQLEGRRAPLFLEEAKRLGRSGGGESLEHSPYLLGSVALGLLVERYGMSSVRALLRSMGEGRPFPQAFREAFPMDPASFEQGVRDFIARGY